MCTQWHSAESLSASNSDDTRLLGMLFSTTAGRPPLPPPHGSLQDSKPCRNEEPAEPAVPQSLNKSKPKPAARSLALQSPMVKKTVVETDKQLDQEVTNQSAPQPRPRQRLASFGGVSSPGSLSPFTGLDAYNQNKNGNKPTSAGNETHVKLSSSVGSRGSTGCLRITPESSGRTTPVTSLGPVHLHHVRDQMVVALHKLKELEEQVKLIPILQVKISVLQEEKRQLISQLKNQSDEDFSKGIDNIARNDCVDLSEFRPLTEEMQALERTVKGRSLQRLFGKGHNLGTDEDMDVSLSEPSKENKYVHTDQIEMRSIGTEVSEINLYTEREAEVDAQQLIIGALKERISHLEAELKESAFQTEMSRMKLELKAAGAMNRADKASFARPSTVGTSTEARPYTTSQGVGNHAEFCDARTGEEIELKAVGICCRPELKDICTGPDVPMSHWEVREQVETMEKCVGIHIFTSTQGVGMELKLCDAETNTEVSVENLGPKVCQCTNIVRSSVSRSTNTRHAFATDSGTNTVLSTRDKHSNTTHAITRTVSVGNTVKDLNSTPEFCKSHGRILANASKQMHGSLTKVTRDTGVGFTNINDNFLVGLKTRHMASGPSHLPDPIRTRSIGVGEGRIHDLTVSSNNPGQKFQQSLQPQWDPELNRYIEKMHHLLKKHLIQEDYNLQREGFALQHNKQENSNPKMSNNSNATTQGGTEIHPFDTPPPGNT